MSTPFPVTKGGSLDLVDNNQPLRDERMDTFGDVSSWIWWGPTGKGFVDVHSFTWMAATDWVSPYGVIGGIKSSKIVLKTNGWSNLPKHHPVKLSGNLTKKHFWGKIVIHWNRRIPKSCKHENFQCRTMNLRPMENWERKETLDLNHVLNGIESWSFRRKHQPPKSWDVKLMIFSYKSCHQLHVCPDVCPWSSILGNWRKTGTRGRAWLELYRKKYEGKIFPICDVEKYEGDKTYVSKGGKLIKHDQPPSTVFSANWGSQTPSRQNCCIIEIHHMCKKKRPPIYRLAHFNGWKENCSSTLVAIPQLTGHASKERGVRASSRRKQQWPDSTGLRSSAKLPGCFKKICDHLYRKPEVQT